MKAPIILLLWLSWIAIVVGGWLTRHFMDYSHLLESVYGFLSALWFWFFATVLGWSIAKKWFISRPPAVPPVKGDNDFEEFTTPFVRLLLSMGLGLGIYTAIILIFGMMIGVTAKSFLILHFVLTILLGSNWIEVLKCIESCMKKIRTISWSAGDIAQAILLTLVILSTLPFALVPNLFADTLRYHFGLTHLFQTAGAITPMPDFAEANISLNWQMIYLAQLTLAGETCAQFFNWLTLPWIVIGIMLAAVSLKNKGYWLAAWIVVSTPFLLSVSTTANNDLGVAFFCVLMWLVVRNSQALSIKKPLFLAGIFGGFALGTKYPSLLAIVGFGVGWFVVGSGKVSERLRQMIGFIMGIGIGYAPWLFRNLWWKGDPFYPTLSCWLPWATESGRWVVDHYQREMSVYGAGMAGLMRLFLSPWRATMADSPYFESDLGLMVWAVLPLVVWGLIKSRSGRMASVATLTFGTLWASGPQVTRFLAAGIPALALAASEGWALIQTKSYRIFLSTIFVFLILSNVWFTWLAIAQISDPFAYFLGRQSREEYLIQRSPPYRMAMWLHRNAPDQKVLLIGVEQVHFFKNPLRVSGPFDLKWIIQQAHEAQSAEDLARRVQADGSQFICLNHQQMRALDAKFGYISWPSEACAKKFRKLIESYSDVVRKDHGFELRKFRFDRVPSS